jgi:hypothetical protein
VRVVARSASFAFAGPAVDLGEVRARLGVAAVVEGSVRRCGDRVRVTARLVDVTTREPLWAEREDGTLSDTFAVQDAIAGRVVARLTSGATPHRAADPGDGGDRVPEPAARPGDPATPPAADGGGRASGATAWSHARRSGEWLVIAR